MFVCSYVLLTAKNAAMEYEKSEVFYSSAGGVFFKFLRVRVFFAGFAEATGWEAPLLSSLGSPYFDPTLFAQVSTLVLLVVVVAVGLDAEAVCSSSVGCSAAVDSWSPLFLLKPFHLFMA